MKRSELKGIEIYAGDFALTEIVVMLCSGEVVLYSSNDLGRTYKRDDGWKDHVLTNLGITAENALERKRYFEGIDYSTWQDYDEIGNLIPEWSDDN